MTLWKIPTCDHCVTIQRRICSAACVVRQCKRHGLSKNLGAQFDDGNKMRTKMKWWRREKKTHVRAEEEKLQELVKCKVWTKIEKIKSASRKQEPCPGTKLCQLQPLWASNKNQTSKRQFCSNAIAISAHPNRNILLDYGKLPCPFAT